MNKTFNTTTYNYGNKKASLFTNTINSMSFVTLLMHSNFEKTLEISMLTNLDIKHWGEKMKIVSSNRIYVQLGFWWVFLDLPPNLVVSQE